jgi:hypothetical protein
MVRVMRVLFVEVPILGALLLAAIGFAVALVLRYELVEPVSIGILCDEAANAPLWCGPRRGLIVSAQSMPGRVLMPALACLLWLVRSEVTARRLGLLVLFLAGFGLVFYNTGLAVVALVIGSLRLIRLEKAPRQA